MPRPVAIDDQLAALVKKRAQNPSRESPMTDSAKDRTSEAEERAFWRLHENGCQIQEQHYNLGVVHSALKRLDAERLALLAEEAGVKRGDMRTVTEGCRYKGRTGQVLTFFGGNWDFRLRLALQKKDGTPGRQIEVLASDTAAAAPEDWRKFYLGSVADD
jgi:hypothetical protein